MVKAVQGLAQRATQEGTQVVYSPADLVTFGLKHTMVGSLSIAAYNQKRRVLRALLGLPAIK
jgi:hypothetical protein